MPRAVSRLVTHVPEAVFAVLAETMFTAPWARHLSCQFCVAMGLRTCLKNPPRQGKIAIRGPGGATMGRAEGAALCYFMGRSPSFFHIDFPENLLKQTPPKGTSNEPTQPCARPHCVVKPGPPKYLGNPPNPGRWT